MSERRPRRKDHKDAPPPPLRKFYAASVREGLALVRRELGDEAIILDTKVYQQDDANGRPQEQVEIWVQEPDAPAVSHSQVTREPVPLPAKDTPDALLDDMEARFHHLAEQLHAAHRQIEELSDGMQWIGTSVSGLSGDVACRIADCLAGAVPVSGGIHLSGERTLVALVGPTGVGKTTQVAKLAWQFAREEGRRAGVITTDTLGVGAVEKIRRYCMHMAVPLEVVYQPDQVPEALERLADCELILIDTAGGSQRDIDYLQELTALLGALDPTEIHLVVSATSHAAVLREMLQAYAAVHPDQLIFTKLDEAATPMDLLPLVITSGLAVSYCSTGQTVPGDLEIASADIISRFVVSA